MGPIAEFGRHSAKSELVLKRLLTATLPDIGNPRHDVPSDMRKLRRRCDEIAITGAPIAAHDATNDQWRTALAEIFPKAR